MLSLACMTLALAASCQQDPAAITTHAVACHHQVEDRSHTAWRDEFDRLTAWLAKPENRAAVQANPAAIAGFEALSAEAGGQRSKLFRWLPHLVHTSADGTRWRLPYGRINSIAVPTFSAAELRGAPPHDKATLLEFVPLVHTKSAAAPKPVASAWQGLTAAQRNDPLSMRAILRHEALVVDGVVRLLPTDEHDPWGTAATIESATKQFAEECRLVAKSNDAAPGGCRFVGFEELRGFDGNDGLRNAPASVRQLNGAHVVMVGRALPVDEVKAARRFMIFESLWGGDWGHPATVTDMVEVTCERGFDPMGQIVRVEGTLRVREQREGEMLLGLYELQAISVTAL